MDTMSAKTNPYDWINPVIDLQLFAGRKEELATIEEEIARLAVAKPIVPVVAVIGERRIGKTSLLRRIEGICEARRLLTILVSLTDTSASEAWEFWHEVFSRLIIAADDEGIGLPPDAGKQMGFRTPVREVSDQVQRPVIDDLWFPAAYKMRSSTSESMRPADYIVQHDLNSLTKAFLEAGYQGVLLMLDEAHLLINVQEVKQQILHAIREAGRCGVIFAGESRLGRMFTDPSEPFFGQVRVVPLKNFTNTDDVAECALLPLAEDERKLMSPMTVDYLTRLSQGKPNQIRLICYSIYKRYLKGEQKDLNITIDILDDVLDIVAEAFQEGELKNRVDTLRRLGSVDLELLYNMTRYPNWSARDVIDLDESFRAEAKSDLATARRERNLQERHAHFVRLGLMVDELGRYVLAGGEFVQLYLRFWYEIRKYGRLSRALVLGKGPPTPFGEKSEKLVRSLAYVLGESPEIRRFIFHPYYREEGDIVQTIRQRFLMLDTLMKGKRAKTKDLLDRLYECLDVCEVVGKAGIFYLLCLSVRNLENPRELMQIELYFDSKELRTVDLLSLFNVLNQQAYDAKVLVEKYDGFLVELPDLESLLNAIGVPSLEDLMAQVSTAERWRLASVQRLVHTVAAEASERESRRDEDIDKSLWIALYAKGDEEGAEKLLSNKLEETQERHVEARLYNDRGYIRCGAKQKVELARKDLETALYLHHFHLPLTLLNLSCIDIDQEKYEPAIRKIEDALLLTFSRLEIEVSYLRLRLPENHLNFKVKWEQHPANVLEASYINLVYATLKSKGYQEALDVLQEGLKLIPSSIRLKHALARLYLFRKRADLAKPIYEELSQKSLPDEGIALEIHLLSRGFGLTGRKPRKRR